jgi:MSHA biogenesis protein MshL
VPDRQVKPIHVTESGVYDALTLIARDAGLSLNIEGGPKTSERFGAAAVFDLKGSLRDVLETLADSMGIFYSVRNNTLFLQQEQQYIVELPPALSEDNAAGLANTLQHLGAKDPYVDRLNRSLVFKTNRKALSRIENYLQKVRGNRALIVYSIDIFQVDLKDNSNIGISWNKLAYNRNGLPASATTQSAAASGIASGTTGAQQTAAAAVGTAVGTKVSATANALGMNLILSSSKLTIDSLIDFLQTQGNVKAISRPRLSIITGSKGALQVGQSTTYVSKIGTNFSTSLNQVTTESRDLRTGLELALYGDYSDNTIYTKLKMSLSEIVRFNKFTALGIDLVLPDVADREIENVIRSRPGDLVLLGGITTDRETRNDNRGVSDSRRRRSHQMSIVNSAKRRYVLVPTIFAGACVKRVRYVAIALAILASPPGLAQMVIEAEVATLQPQINRDEVGYFSCGVRAVVVTKAEADFIDAYDFSMNLSANTMFGTLKAGKTRKTKAEMLQGKTSMDPIMPAPVKFWIAKESEGQAVMPQKVIPAETKGYILERADMTETMKAIMATIAGERMQFAVRYKSEPVDVVVSFSANLAERERGPMMACLNGLVKRITDRPRVER